MRNTCCICKKEIDTETASLLVMSGFGSPRFICEDCEADVNTATADRDIDAIYAAMDRLGKNLTVSSVEDTLVLTTVKNLMDSAKERAEKIKLGEYDFSEEEERTAEDEEVPSELLETEEDKRLSEEEDRKNAKLDKITNWVCLAVLLAAALFLVYRFFIS